MSAPAAGTVDEGGQAVSGPVFLDRLSDEELVLLGAEHALIQLSHHQRLSTAQQDLAVISAMRGFRARGYDVDPDARTIALPEHLCDVLDLRASAPCVLMVQVVVPVPGETAGMACQHYAFVEDDFVLLEDVTGDGLHDFWALELPELAAGIQDRVPLMEGAADGAGGPLNVDLMAVAAGESQVTVDCLGQPLAQIDATVWCAPATPEPPLQAIVIGDRGTYVSVATAGVEGPVTLQPIQVSGVGEEVVRLLNPGTMTR